MISNTIFGAIYNQTIEPNINRTLFIPIFGVFKTIAFKLKATILRVYPIVVNVKPHLTVILLG